MTDSHHSSDLPTLDLLGRRLEAAITERRAPVRWSRRTLALAASALVALAATPAVASITGVFDGGSPTLEESLPAVVDRSDPVATGRALERRGFTVRWMLIEDNPDRDFPTVWRSVPAPPPGTRILSLLNAQDGDTATTSTRSVVIEIAPAGSEILRSHD
jgi:hypothetical protein